MGCRDVVNDNKHVKVYCSGGLRFFPEVGAFHVHRVPVLPENALCMVQKALSVRMAAIDPKSMLKGDGWAGVY